MKSTPLQRLLSLVLTIVMLVQLVPMPALADTGSTSAAVELSEEQPPTTIVGEEEDLRTEAVKHFRLSDGSYIAVSYGMPVHYQEEDGSWEDIDNTLTVETNAAGQVSYATAQTATAAQFSGSLATGHLFTASQGDVSVSMTLLNSLNANQMVADANAELVTIPGGLSSTDQPISFNTSATAQIVSDEPAMYTVPESEGWTIDDLVPETLQSTLLYEDVYPGVDLEYTAYGYNIKEQIIVNTPQTSYRYDFFLELSGLVAVLNEDGSISLLDREEKQVYYIPAPFMIDDNSIISYDVTYELTQVEGGVVLTVIADTDWMSAEDRAFPVKIDPTLMVDSKRASLEEAEDIYATYVMKGNPTKYSGGYQHLYTGYSSIETALEYQSFIHFTQLPEIPTGSFVCAASYSMYLYDYTHVQFEEMPLGAYEVTSEKPSTWETYYDWIVNLNWNRKPTFDTENIIDYALPSENKIGTALTWDLTELVKKWYAEDEENCTIAITCPCADECRWWYCAVPVFYAFGSTRSPIFLVSYRNNTGIESYYSYAGLGAGNAGAAYIADATGQLKVVNQVASYASTVNPFSLNLVYNSDYFAADNTVDYQPPEKLGLSMRLGSGWTLDAIQYVEKETIAGIEYIRYHDGDGTVHYFPKDSSDGKYYDEDGLGLTIVATSSTVYTMSDDKDNTWTFTNGYLTAIKDASGNQILINYSNGKITSIQQKNNGASAITVASFTYSGNYVTQITDAAGYVTSLTNSGGKLTAIAYQGTTIASYGYDGYRIKKVTDSLNNYAINFTYSFGKIASYQEAGGSTNGAGCAITYPNYSETVYRDYGLDRTANTSDDILTHYLFDNWGRTANAYTTDVNGTVLGASNAAYTANNGSDRTNNRTLRSASIGVAGQQLMKDFGFENGSSGTAWSLSSGTSYSATISTTKPRTGQYSVKVNTGSSVTATVSATRSSNSLTAGKTYTLSAYVNTTGITAFNGNGIYLQVKDSSGNTWKSNYLNYTTVDTMDNGWVRISVTFTAEVSGAHTVGIYSNKTVGTFYADDFQLEVGEAPSNTNLLENGDMSTTDYAWTLPEYSSYYDGTLQLYGDARLIEASATQTVKINLPGTQTFVLSGWVEANAVPDNLNIATDPAQDTAKQCGLRAVLTYSDNTVEYHYVPFNPDLTERQFVSYSIVPKEENKTISTIQIVCAYERNANVAYFDDISLVREAAQTMKYDDDGNLVSITTSGLNEDTNAYNSENDLIKTVTSGNGTYEYTYDDKHRLTGVKVMNLATSDTSDTLLTQAMVYDTYGNVTSTTLTGTSTRTLKSSATYTNYGNLIETATDSSGIKTTYAYSAAANKMFGIPSTITDAKSTATTQSIDIYGRQDVISVANTSKVDYNYTGSLLNTIARTDIGQSLSQSYTFTYDAFGNMKTVKAGSYTLASYTYGSKNGPLTKQTYGNGATVSFAYDNLGRNKTTTYSGGRTLTYAYTGDGQLYSIKDSTLGKYVYTYDTLGRLIASQRFNTSDGFVMGTNQTYNANNQLVGQSWKIGSTSYAESYTYNTSDGSISSMTSASGKTLTYSYDYLRRLSSVTGGINARQYTYRDISSTQTSTQVSTLHYPNLATPLTYTYTYDALGNISTISDPLSGERSYTYDAQGQLLKETIDGTTYEYTYDGFGNLLTANGHTYTYGNTGWRDLLTAYDGESITYDASGNPTSYYNGTRWTFGWAEGRNLVSASGGGHSVTYAYDHNGVRTTKTVDGVVHTYYYASGKLLRETYGSNTLDFFYDASGAPYAFKYNGTLYYYVLNLQGDVVRIVNSSGTSWGIYRYDAWGNILYQTDNEVLNANPLRYRGYYFDSETELYYLQSRYYDPQVGRFINADMYVATGLGVLGHNMFAYCNSNPINLLDIMGSEPDDALDTDGDGEIDCYVYTYTYTISFLFWEIEQGTGTVYFYTNVMSEEEFNNLVPPEGFNPKTDLLVGDWTHNSNSTLFAYQAQNVNENHREKIVDIMFEYTEDYGKKWERTKASVMFEWKEHHKYHLFSSRAQNIDFDEKEEGKDAWYYFVKAINAALN